MEKWSLHFLWFLLNWKNQQQKVKKNGLKELKFLAAIEIRLSWVWCFVCIAERYLKGWWKLEDFLFGGMTQPWIINHVVIDINALTVAWKFERKFLQIMFLTSWIAWLLLESKNIVHQHSIKLFQNYKSPSKVVLRGLLLCIFRGKATWWLIKINK